MKKRKGKGRSVPAMCKRWFKEGFAMGAELTRTGKKRSAKKVRKAAPKRRKPVAKRKAAPRKKTARATYARAGRSAMLVAPRRRRR